MPPRILIAGCGLSGAATFHYLRSLWPSVPLSSYTIWEQSKVGGRMHTDKQFGSTCDMGAQYLTKKSDNYNEVYSQLLSNGIINELQADTIDGMRPEHYKLSHYSSSYGISSIVSELCKECQYLSTDTLLYDLKLGDGKDGWIASKKSMIDNVLTLTTEQFDVVVLTMPALKISSIGGMAEILTKNNFKDALDGVSYSSRYALALYYKGIPPVIGAATWNAKYVYDDEIIRYISIESRKGHNQQSQADTVTSILIHTTVPFAIANSVQSESVTDAILANLKRYLPGLEEPMGVLLKHWQPSQVNKCIGMGDGLLFIGDDLVNADILSKTKKQAILAIAGDAFTESTFEGCLKSAKHVASEIQKQYNNFN